MNRRELLTLALGLGVSARVGAADKDKHGRIANNVRDSSLLSQDRESKDKSPGTYRMTIDNRGLEITLPEPEPHKFYMAQSVTTRGVGRDFEKALYSWGNNIKCFYAGWQYGFSDGALFGNSAGLISVGLNAIGDTFYTVEDPEVITHRIGSYEIKGRKRINLDYTKLDDFMRALHLNRDIPSRYRIEFINGRRWTRLLNWARTQGNRDLPPPTFREFFYTPIEQGKYLIIMAQLSLPLDYEIPDEMPSWAQRASRNITAVLRSIKLSPPDDGSPDHFLLDPEMKLEAEPVTFPGRW